MFEELLKWYEKNKRKLPWRLNPSPYGIWISEIMAQQTRIETVIPYYNRFMAALPTIKDLAEVDEDILLKLWQGLGYYNRARNLKKAAQKMMTTFQGTFPTKYEDVLSLSGIGEYTAGAILSMAYHLPYAAVDGNVLRVFSRLEMDCSDISLVKTKVYWKNKIEQLPISDFGSFNQALMDLGATICLPNDIPLCDKCPLKECCKAHLNHQEMDYPVHSKSITKKIEEWTILLVVYEGKVLLHKRPQTGLLAGLYEFPNRAGHLTNKEVKNIFEEDVLRIEEGPIKTHIFTHKKWIMYSYFVKLSSYRLKDDEKFYSMKQIMKNLSIPKAFLQFLPVLKC